jgi:hypothetical protein
VPIRQPITGIAFCCARSAGAAAIAPASTSINSRFDDLAGGY